MNAFSDFDSGGSGSQGPWLGWSARGTQDGSVPAQNFFLRDQDGRQPFDGIKQGIVLDLATAKTGWCYSSGVAGQAPDWKWNPSISRFEQKPGDDYKKGFSVRCAIGNERTATWEDSGAGAWNAFAALAPEFAAGPDGKLPMVRMTGARIEKYARGSTAIPILEVVRWVDRPACLRDGAAAGIDTGEPTTSASKPVAKPANVSEEITF